MRALAEFVMRGRTQAIIVVLGLGILSLVVPLVSMVSAATLGLITLRAGLRQSAWVLVGALLGLCALGVLLHGEWLPAFIYGLLLWTPVWLGGLLLRLSGQLGLTMEVVTGLAMLTVTGIYLVLDDAASFWSEAMRRFLQPMLEHAPPGVDPAQMDQTLEFFARYMNGVAASGAMISLILSLFLARWSQALLFNPGGFRAEFLPLRLHRGVVYAGLALLVAAVASSGVASEIAWNLVLPFTVLCLFVGFAILHATTARTRMFWRVGIYVLIALMPQAMLPLVLLGLTDTWLDWRRRFGYRT